jgi:hypothetical protein
MIRMVLRLLAGAAALFLIFVGVQFWIDPVKTAAGMGLVAQSAAGLANLRADNAGAFLGTGIIALTGAVRGDRRYFIAPLVFLFVAIIGRGITVATAGFSYALVPPMVIEAVFIVIFGAASRSES